LEAVLVLDAMLIYGSKKEGASSGRLREGGNSCTASEQMTRRMLAWLGFTFLGIALVQPAAAPNAHSGSDVETQGAHRCCITNCCENAGWSAGTARALPLSGVAPFRVRVACGYRRRFRRRGRGPDRRRAAGGRVRHPSSRRVCLSDRSGRQCSESECSAAVDQASAGTASRDPATSACR